MDEQPVGARFGRLRHLFASPVRFFRARLNGPPRHAAALLPVFLYIALTSAAALVSTRRIRQVTDAVFQDAANAAPPAWFMDLLGVVSAVTTGCALFLLSALAVLALDMLFAQSGRGRRLVEFTGLAFYSQLPLALAVLVFTIWWQEFDTLRLPADATGQEIADAVLAQQQEAAAAAGLSTLRLMGSYFWCWLVALQATALRVVSGFSTGGAWAAGILLGVVFVGLPYAAQQLW